MTAHVFEVGTEGGPRGTRPVFPLRNAPRWAVEATGRRGYVLLLHTTAMARLGRPRARSCVKSRHEWIVHTPHGPVAVYDYGVGDWPDDLTDVVVEWHLGAHNHLAAAWIGRYLLSGCAHLTDPVAPRCRHCAQDAEHRRAAARDDDLTEPDLITSEGTP